MAWCKVVINYLSNIIADYQQEWNQKLYLFLMAHRALAYKTIGHNTSYVVFGRVLRLTCELKFGFKPNEALVGDDYSSNLRHRIGENQDRVRTVYEASDRMKKHNHIRAIINVGPGLAV